MTRRRIKSFNSIDSMIQKTIRKLWSSKLYSFLAIIGVIDFSQYYACAQVMPDNTLGSEQSIVNSITSTGFLRQQIEGGAIRGGNLFHSFQDFNISGGQSVYFQNPIGIKNIFSRVTGGNPSNIEGTLGVSGGAANLFLINPNGIIFGANARLDVGGSFVTTTAPAIQFGTQGFFSSSAPNSPPLLTVNPSAFLFNQVSSTSIVNRSTTPLESGGQGLQVPDGRSLILLGGDVNLEGGGVNAAGGRVELGAVAGTSIVGMSVDDNNLHLSFPATLNRADISLTNGATVNTSGEGGGSIQIWGRRVFMNGGSQVAAFTLGAKPGGGLTVDASESLELIGRASSGNLSTLSFGDGKAGDLTIITRNLSVRDGAQILSGTLGNGSAGDLSVNASESVEVAGRASNTRISSALASFTGSAGQAGNLTINTKRLIVRDGGALTAESLSTTVNGQALSVSGGGGNLTINASDSVELLREGSIFADAQGSGNAGNLTINTGRLLLEDKSVIVVDSTGSGNAGNIIVNARSVELKNQSEINAQTTESQGGNIVFQDVDLLLLRTGSFISTTAGTDQAGGNGGNITFDGKFIVGVANENSDISANAFTGRGGNVVLNAQGIFGIQPRPQLTPLSDITASSEFGISGTVTLNTPNTDPSRGTTTLPTGLVDTNALIANSCIARTSRQGRFTITGTGGVAAQPDDLANSSFPTYELVPDTARSQTTAPSSTLRSDEAITEPDGVYRLANGEVVLGRSCR
jgi:filamentous hemagglutinin family protein